MRVQELFRELKPVLGEGESWELIARVLGDQIPRLRLMNPTCSEPALTQIRSAVEAFSRGVPIAYSLGFADFYGRRLTVSPAVLIPRQETEELVAHACTFAQPDITLIDCGTGSGAIAISCALEASWKRVEAWDISAPALEVAKQNAQNLHATVDFHLGDVTSEAWGDWFRETASDGPVVVTANLPYIPSEEMADLDREVLAEPHLALDGGPFGTAVFREWLLQVARSPLKNMRLLLEADPANVEDLTRFCSGLGFAVEWRADVAGLLRFCDIWPADGSGD
ncbi:peptide chain release factor N(5)-glutamine methyltransferase [Candidatus Gracilibacteria bacterium CG17_big_fil_post_rev_8_21_14_2_50_48_13]|nr:MAG: peptide chain release factor N(5)-glutamine methyltransferase [Candidatus Gracilibacteria bacterium CG17_big_fil_post_rev_8_21_14_2_50_48_13]